MTGGDNHRRCDTCDQHLYGDSFALTNKGTHAGTGNDLLTAGLSGKSYLDGMGSDPGGGGRGKTLCAGNQFGDNSAINCAVYKDIQHILKHEQPPPPLKQFGADWPARSTSP
jgi:hypothetical protein